MSNSKIILLTKGNEDIYLTEGSKNSFFKFNQKTYSYFGQNWNIINPNKDFKFNDVQKTVLQLPLEGDLITNMVLRLNISGSSSTISTDASGKYHALEFLDTVTFKYNDQVLSTIDYNYIALSNKIGSDNLEYKNFREMTSITTESLENTFMDINRDLSNNVLHIPLPFWFTKNPGSAFPIWLLTRPRLVIEIKLRNNITTIRNLDLLVQYTNLTSTEKDIFKDSSLEYLIEQVEIVNKKNFTSQNKVKVNLPRSKYIKYMLWNILDQTATNDLDSKDYIKKSTLLLNGTPVLDKVDKNRTSLINRYNYFKIPYINRYGFNGGGSYTHYKDNNDLNIHIHSFCLNPLEFQSTGFLTTEKYNDFTLEIDTLGINKTGRLHVYLVKHNILRFKDGILNLLHN